MKQLSKELIDEITSRLAKALHPESIYLFGSHAKGFADRDSDVDLFVVVPDTDVDQRQLARQGRRSLWGLRIPVDLVVCTDSQVKKWAPVNCNFIHTVIKKGRLIKSPF